MKSVCAAMLLLAAMAGCASEEGLELGAPGERAERADELGAPTATEVTAAMPAEAAQAMREASASALAPLFYECPPRIAFDPVALNGNGGPVSSDWTALRSASYALDKPKLAGNPMRWYAMCGTTQSADPWVSLRKALPAGYTTCTTSAVGVVPAWLVCT